MRGSISGNYKRLEVFTDQEEIKYSNKIQVYINNPIEQGIYIVKQNGSNH